LILWFVESYDAEVRHEFTLILYHNVLGFVFPMVIRVFHFCFYKEFFLRIYVRLLKFTFELNKLVDMIGDFEFRE